jgi:UDP:flavonoid glycosyltransferase YjiC (YdhE family)
MVMPSSFELAGYPDYYGPGEVLDPRLDSFFLDDGRPGVVCSIGDGWAQALPEPLHRLAAHANSGDYRLLVVSGRIPDLSCGPRTTVVPAVNLRAVVDRADVFVHHGGMGSVIAALRAAVPSVTMAQWPDGRRNAALLATAGLGIDVGSAPGVDEVDRAVREALADDAMADRLRSARASLLVERDAATVLLDLFAVHSHRETVSRERMFN